jgi:hypothetical protein
LTVNRQVLAPVAQQSISLTSNCLPEKRSKMPAMNPSSNEQMERPVTGTPEQSRSSDTVSTNSILARSAFSVRSTPTRISSILPIASAR